MALDFEILGHGIYSPQQAARLVGGKSRDVLRWTQGVADMRPVWKAFYRDIPDSKELSFSDLVELRVVKAFRDEGISLQAIRFAIEYAENTYGVTRPLSTLRFKTDGREILHEALEQDGQLVSLARGRAGQKVFTEIVRQSLSGLEYEGDNAVRWRPINAKHVVLDPERQFGAPILEEYGVSTSTLFAEFDYFKDIDYLARIYELPKKLVSEAIRYEQALDCMSANGKGSI